MMSASFSEGAWKGPRGAAGSRLHAISALARRKAITNVKMSLRMLFPFWVSSKE
jgi:hypothetical protein